MKTSRLLLSALLAAALLSLTACTIEEEDFPEVYASDVCDKFQSCEPEDFDAFYDDFEDCVNDWAALTELMMDAADLLGQTYDPDKARDCVQEIRRADCDNFSSNELTCDIHE